MKYIFIGYSVSRKAYRLWDQEKKIVHEARDVVFMEKDFDNRVNASKSDTESLMMKSVIYQPLRNFQMLKITRFLLMMA